MSNLVFPQLAGLDVAIKRTPFYSTKVNEAISGREYRHTWWTYPRTRYDLSFNILRADSSLSLRTREWQQAVGHFMRHLGQGDSFLFADPDDQAVTDHGFAAGDGVTTAFQLQRSLAGAIVDQYGVTSQNGTKPRTNLCIRSQDMDLWTLHGGGGNNYSVRANQDVAPDGTPTADIISTYNATFGDALGIFIESGPRNDLMTFSVWLRAGIATSAQIFILDQSSGNIRGTTTCALTSAWQRFSVTATTIAGNGWRAEIQINASSGTISAWGAQVEFGAVATQYIPTSGSTVTVNPKYWPQTSDGFEPVFDLQSPATLYQDGDWPGRRQLYATARTNQLLWSEQFDNAAWVKNTCSVVANATTAPDGTVTADQFNEGAVATATHFLQQTISPITGELRCYSVFLKANTLPNILWGRDVGGYIQFNLSTGVIAGTGGPTPILASGVITSTLWPGWYRIWFTLRENTAQSTIGQAFIFGTDAAYNPTYTGTSRTFYMWGAQGEIVSNLLGPTPYIGPTVGAALTRTDYALSSTGSVTPGIVLPAGAFLSWDGQFFHRVRFEKDDLPTERLAQYMWASKSIGLVSVKP